MNSNTATNDDDDEDGRGGGGSTTTGLSINNTIISAITNSLTHILIKLFNSVSVSGSVGNSVIAAGNYDDDDDDHHHATTTTPHPPVPLPTIMVLANSNNIPVEEEDLSTQQEFHNNVRENIIFLLFFLTLTCVGSFVIEWMTSSPPPPPSSSSRSTVATTTKRMRSRNITTTTTNNNPQIRSNNTVTATTTTTNNRSSSTGQQQQQRNANSGSVGDNFPPAAAAAAADDDDDDDDNEDVVVVGDVGGADADNDDDDDEGVVKRICSWLCTLTLSTSISATLLLPISILSNEILLLYPTNSYLEWLNGMLIQGLWSLVFLFSNIGLFVLLPFAHLFVEAEGFSGKKKGLVSKLQETLVILTLLTFTVWGIAVIVNSLVLTRGSNVLFHFNQLPFIYSFISFVGVLVLTLCTPYGLSHLFTLLSKNFVFVPEFLRNLETEHVCAVLECENLRNRRGELLLLLLDEEGEEQQLSGSCQQILCRRGRRRRRIHPGYHSSSSPSPSATANNSTTLQQQVDELGEDIDRLSALIKRLDTLRSTPPWKRNLLYPGLLLSILSVTGVTVFIVLINAIKIVVGFRDLSLEVVAKETLPLGRSSLSFLGPSGAIFEIILVMYLITTCLIGLYNLPGFRSVTPVRGRTPTTHLILNCGILLVLSSALPVFMRILGLTNFDLLGTYAGKIDWIENTLIVVFVNLLFSVLTLGCLINKVKMSRGVGGGGEVVRWGRALVHFFSTGGWWWWWGGGGGSDRKKKLQQIQQSGTNNATATSQF